jgi:hypothetical protein
LQCNVCRKNNDGPSPEGNCSSYCNLKDTVDLISVGDQLTVLTALPEQTFRMSLLKVPAPDFSYGNICRNRQDWHPATVAIVESINEMRVSWSAAPRADSKVSRKVSFVTSRKCGTLLVSKVHLGDVLFVFSDRFSNSI